MNSLVGKKIFIVEDSHEFLDELKAYFGPNNQLTYATNFFEAKEQINLRDYDIILLDVLLPDGNGIDLIPLIKQNIPIIILSDLGSEEHILHGLTSGANDYMVKPYSLRVLEQRMLLRLLPKDQAFISINGLNLNTNTRSVTFENEELNLTKSEFDLLYFLMSHPNTFFTSDEIYENIWNMDSLNTGTVRYHIYNLRKKMHSASPRCSDLLVTKFGGGYAFRGSDYEK